MCGRTAQGLVTVTLITLGTGSSLHENDAPGQIRQQLARTLPSKPADTWIDEDKYRTSYNVAPTRYQPVVRADPQTKSYVVHMMRWGLIPRNTQSMPEYSSVLKSINARDDSLFMGPSGKVMFNHSKNHKRCILLAEGFYEWRRRGKERIPFYTRRRDGNLMLMAAIYDVAKVKEEAEPMYTYATITTNASPQLDWLHDRMPVLIPNHDHDKIRAWLDPNLKWNATLEAMLKPCDEFMEPSLESGREPVYALETYQVDEKVNSVRNDSPDFTKPWNSSANKKTLNRFFFAKTEPASSESPRPALSSSASTPLKKDNHLKHKDGVNDFNEPFDYADDMTVASDSADNTVKDEEEFSQEQVSVAADDSKREEGFAEQQEQRQQGRIALSASGEDNDDLEDRELALALELSHQEQANYQPSTSPLTSITSKPASSSSPSTQIISTPGSTADSPTRSAPRTMQVISSSLTGSVDLLEKRRQQRKQEEDEMKHILEMSRLEAIADGHEDVSGEDSSQDGTTTSALSFASEVPPLWNEENVQDDLKRQEAEELEKAIAASLNDSTTAASPTSSPSYNNHSSLSHPKRPVQSLSPTASPRKRKTTAQSSPSSPAGSSPMKPTKKSKASQDVKITSFFQHMSSS
ncbi:hypothetical protein BG015_009683 [Linnemannia schmuckeri]|uniref:DUF159-domain-containing protein n=1 Tax=Linnemannia schmuckeri TaxID=64567 RepID=A0A9P5S7P7_9FUNG|nr:hypothetical protein BG015_009683 [Linnemannia schmuckeri]